MRVSYRTFGCKANQYDTERIRQELEARGFRTVARSDADVVVVNTCTVTNRADADARRFIRRIRRESPAVRVIAVGCSVALREGEYAAMPGVSAAVPGHDPVMVASAAGTVVPKLVQLSARTSLERVDQEPVGAEILLRRAGASRGWLKIQDGCDRRCSFCATRLARGPSRSRPMQDIVREARQLARTHPELVLTGIHIGHYGRDLEPRVHLSGLVARLLDAVPGVRFRLGSIEATEVDELLVRLLEESDGRLAPHLHMPLQSGSDAVLRRMRRWHTREAYRSRALEIAARVGPLGLGADIITGFPLETDTDHARTVALVEELPYTYLHVFPYSPREGTHAARDHLAHPVPQRVAGERGRELREIVAKKAERYARSRDGSSDTVVLEGEDRKGLTGDYLRVDVEPVSVARSPLHRSRNSIDPPPSSTEDAGRLGAEGSMPELRDGTLRWRRDHLTIDLSIPAGFN